MPMLAQLRGLGSGPAASWRPHPRASDARLVAGEFSRFLKKGGVRGLANAIIHRCCE